MKRFYLMAALCLLAAVISTCCQAQEKINDSAFQDCVDATVRIRRAAGRFTNFGSGVVVKETDQSYVVVTNHHVANRRGTVNTIDVFNWGYHVASIQAATVRSWFRDGHSKDIAILNIPKSKLGGEMPVIPLSEYGKSKLKKNDRIMTAGSSDGRWTRLRVGHVLKIERGLIYYLPQSIGGDSGGPVFSADGKEVVGITAWAIQDQKGRWVGLAMTADRVNDIMSGRVTGNDFFLPKGAVPITELSLELPPGAVRPDEQWLCDCNGCCVKLETKPDYSHVPRLAVSRTWNQENGCPDGKCEIPKDRPGWRKPGTAPWKQQTPEAAKPPVVQEPKDQPLRDWRKKFGDFERRFDGFDSNMRTRFESLAANLRSRIDNRFDKLDERLNQFKDFETRETAKQRFNRFEARQEAWFRAQEQRLKNQELRQQRRAEEAERRAATRFQRAEARRKRIASFFEWPIWGRIRRLIMLILLAAAWYAPVHLFGWSRLWPVNLVRKGIAMAKKALDKGDTIPTADQLQSLGLGQRELTALLENEIESKQDLLDHYQAYETFENLDGVGSTMNRRILNSLLGLQ